jgi:hypothetical protein
MVDTKRVMAPHHGQQRPSCFCRLLILVPSVAMAQSVRCLYKQGIVVRLLTSVRDLPFSDAFRKITRRNRLVGRGLFPLGVKQPKH